MICDRERVRREHETRCADIDAIRTPDEKKVAEQIKAQRAAYEALAKDEQQTREEIEVFDAFAAASEVSIDRGSAAKGDADRHEPDIRCSIKGKLRYFELCRVIDRDVARITGNALSRMKVLGTQFSQTEPFVYAIQKKCKKAYETSGAPVELVLYYRYQSPPPSQQFAELIESSMTDLEALIARGPFKRVWIFDFAKVQILWRSSAKAVSADPVSKSVPEEAP